MADFIIKNCTLIGETILENQSVYCKKGKIHKVFGPEDNIPSGIDSIDAQGLFLAPGFIDLHIHGLEGRCLDNGTAEYKYIAANLPKFGVTGFLPTLAPQKAGNDSLYLSKLANTDTDGAQTLGFHLEGPFLSITGALPPEALGSADKKRVEKLITAAKPYKTIFSISPEFEGIENLLPIMRQDNSPVFITHTAANVEQTLKAIELGACHATHFYDVFYPPAETDPGVRPCGAVEAILASPDVSVDFILDGEHVDPIAVKMALNCKGMDKVCLVTDASPGAGACPGIHKFAGCDVEIKYPGGPARIVSSNSLAGSGLTMDIAVANAVKLLEIDLCQAVKLASSNPAKVLGLENTKGQIKEGFDADLVLLDKNMNVNKTWIKGLCKYDKNKEGN